LIKKRSDTHKVRNFAIAFIENPSVILFLRSKNNNQPHTMLNNPVSDI